jgi:2-iminoacetate synthase ThiH
MHQATAENTDIHIATTPEEIKWTIAQAKQSGCDQVHLDSGPQRHEAHRLYLNQGFKIIGYHFALEI